MNFIDYCIATKNFSALGAIRNYSKVTDTIKKHKNKILGSAAALTAATSVAALDRDTSRAIRRAVGKSNSFDDAYYHAMDQLKDNDKKNSIGKLLDDYRDSRIGRAVAESKGEGTLRDKYLDLKDKLIGGNKLDEINEKYGLNDPDDRIYNPVKNYNYLKDLEDEYIDDDED